MARRSRHQRVHTASEPVLAPLKAPTPGTPLALPIPMTAICDICNACHDPRCQLDIFHDPDCCGLAIWVELCGVVLCCECAASLEGELRDVEQVAD
jgi:hypothetical protein